MLMQFQFKCKHYQNGTEATVLRLYLVLVYQHGFRISLSNDFTTVLAMFIKQCIICTAVMYLCGALYK